MTDSARTAGRPWVKLDAVFFEDDDLMAAVEATGNAVTMLAWVLLLCHARRKESEGTLSARQCRLALASIELPQAHMDALTAHGLLARGNDGSVTIRNYAIWQQTGTEIDGNREKWATKQAKRRLAARESGGESPGESGGESPGESGGESGGESPGDTPESPSEKSENKKKNENERKSQTEKEIQSKTQSESKTARVPADPPSDYDGDGQGDAGRSPSDGTAGRVDVEVLCQHFADSVVEVVGFKRRPTVDDGWRADMQGLIDDPVLGLEPADVRAVIAWAHGDDFWRSKVLTPAKLKELYERLSTEAASERKKRSSRRKGGGGAPARRAAEQRVADLLFGAGTSDDTPRGELGT